MNPVRAKMVRLPEEWPWSSYRATAGQIVVPNWLNIEWILAAFGNEKSRSIKAYQHFVSQGERIRSPLKELRNQVFLGGDNFIERMNLLIDGDKDLSEIPSSQRRPLPKPLNDYIKRASSRNEAILFAYDSGGYSFKEIGDHFGLHYTSISRIVRNARC
ncbi:hypothetical protein N9060_02500 [Arenicella sp.]|nr:hypothetical protein [Arenicella sp.]